MDNLRKLIEKYGSDKNASNYTDSYLKFFEPLKDKQLNILEIGLGTIVP